MTMMTIFMTMMTIMMIAINLTCWPWTRSLLAGSTMFGRKARSCKPGSSLQWPKECINTYSQIGNLESYELSSVYHFPITIHLVRTAGLVAVELVEKMMSRMLATTDLVTNNIDMAAMFLMCFRFKLKVPERWRT